MSLHFFESAIDMPLKMIRLPIRCTAVKLPNALILISPIDFNTEQFKRIDALGDVTDIVAPTLIHNKFVGRAMERWKSAKIWGPLGYQEKCPHIRWDYAFGRDPWKYSDALEVIALEGIPDFKEIAFFDKESRTLIVADALFNLQHPQGWAAPVMLRLFGSYKKFACSKLFAGKVKDKNAMRASLKKVMAWPFDRVVMAHGDIVPSGAHEMTENAFRERGLL